MFLSRMSLNPARRGTRHLLSSRERMHAAVLASFPPGDGESRVLWRVDEAGPAVTLYVVSPREPDFTHLVEQAGWPTTEAWQAREYDPFLARLEANQRWHFRISCNPVRQVRQEGRRSRFQAMRTPKHIEEWLDARAELAGFTVVPNDVPGHVNGRDVVVSEIQTLRFSKRSAGSRSRTVTISSAACEGTLRVDEPELLRRALSEGIGRGRAYGCGLMTLAPV